MKLQMTGAYKDKETKMAQGYFRYFHANGNLESAGNYVNGKKESTWIFYHDDGMMKDSLNYTTGMVFGTSLSWHKNGYLSDSAVINNDGSSVQISWFDNGVPSAAGRYSRGKKATGKWQFFNQQGKLCATEIYNDGMLISKEYFDGNGNLMDTTGIDGDALFPGGQKAWQKYLEKQLYFPNQYKITGADKAVVLVAWEVDEAGSVVNPRVTGPFAPQFDKIALQVIQKSPKWKPAGAHNRKIKTYKLQPVTFAQEQL